MPPVPPPRITIRCIGSFLLPADPGRVRTEIIQYPVGYGDQGRTPLIEDVDHDERRQTTGSGHPAGGRGRHRADRRHPLRVLVVGGVAGGMSAATRLRRLDETAEITVVERSGHVSYANCGLPYFVGGVIEDEDDLLLQTPERLHERFRLDVRVDTEVVGIDADGPRRHRAVHASTAPSTHLALRQAGPQPRRRVGPAADPRLRPGPDPPHRGGRGSACSATSRRAPGRPWSSAPGSSASRRRRTSSTAASTSPSWRRPTRSSPRSTPSWRSWSRPSWWPTASRVDTGVAVTEVTGDAVVLADGRTLPGDLVVGSIGVRPDTRLAVLAGLAIGPAGGIAVTGSGPDQPSGHLRGRRRRREGRLGRRRRLAGRPGQRGQPPGTTRRRPHRRARPCPPSPSIGTAIVKVFALTAAMTGWSETRLRAAGRPYRCVHSHPMSHATYYPGAEQMALKLLFDPIDGDDPRCPGRRRHRRRQAHRRAGHGDGVRDPGAGPGRSGTRLRPAVLVGQGPGQHARLHGRERPVRRVRRGRAGRAARPARAPAGPSSTSARRPSTRPGRSRGASAPRSTPSATTCRHSAADRSPSCARSASGVTPPPSCSTSWATRRATSTAATGPGWRPRPPVGRHRTAGHASFVNIRWTSSSG